MPLAEYIPKVVTEQDSIHNLYVTTYRWLHYAINAMGDPETPIFNVMPQEIKSAYVHSPSSRTLIVKPYLDGARVCVSSSGKGSYYKVFNNIMHDEEVTFEDLDYDDYDIWITKQNYKPLHLSL